MNPDVTLHSPRPIAAFRGAVSCHRSANALVLTGPAGDTADEQLILTFITPVAADLPATLTASDVLALDEHHYRIVSLSRDWEVEAATLHIHRDVRTAFYRAIPPRPAPLKKRLFWHLVLALAGSRFGRRLLSFLRSR